MQRLVVSLLHSNRYLYRYDVKPADHTTFTQVYQVGATKEGAAFAVHATTGRSASSAAATAR